ncbi:MAG: hypothetical protein MI685_11795 [Chlorobiales bacterium]|nr:hypothetical protein [Chlorobiales bacterium]
MKILLAVMIVGLLLQGCATTKILTLEPQALDGQQKVIQEGREAIFSPKKALVTIRPGANTYSSDGRPKFVVTVVNSTEEPFDFSTEDIQVFVDGEPHKVFTYDELVADVKREQPLSDRNRTEQFLSVLNTTALKRTTVLPRAWHGGYVTIEKIPNANHLRDVRVVIRAAGEDHEFLFKHYKAQQ